MRTRDRHSRKRKRSFISASTKYTTPMPVNMNIKLAPIEQQIFDTILAACAYHKLETQPRVAGGWVRDHLLERPSMDIDIALDDMKGQDFAEKINEYLVSIGQPVHNIGVIKINPDQSKHLETATFKIHGVDIDANNLRTEVYSSCSRIPVTVLGTPREDAMRRDFTINAMFYNIKTKQIEDYLTGITDLKHRLIRTPCPALTTFNDDPLRVLRAARFANRYHYSIDKELCAAASSDSVRLNLMRKVSRERFGIEVEKMLSESVGCVEGIGLLCYWGLRPVIFMLPPEIMRDPVLPAHMASWPLAQPAQAVASTLASSKPSKPSKSSKSSKSSKVSASTGAKGPTRIKIDHAENISLRYLLRGQRPSASSSSSSTPATPATNTHRASRAEQEENNCREKKEAVNGDRGTGESNVVVVKEKLGLMGLAAACSRGGDDDDGKDVQELDMLPFVIDDSDVQMSARDSDKSGGGNAKKGVDHNGIRGIVNESAIVGDGKGMPPPLAKEASSTEVNATNTQTDNKNKNKNDKNNKNKNDTDANTHTDAHTDTDANTTTDTDTNPHPHPNPNPNPNTNTNTNADTNTNTNTNTDEVTEDEEKGLENLRLTATCMRLLRAAHPLYTHFTQKIQTKKRRGEEEDRKSASQSGVFDESAGISEEEQHRSCAITNNDSSPSSAPSAVPTYIHIRSSYTEAVLLEERVTFLLAAFLSPFHGLSYRKKKKVLPVIPYIIRDSIKMRTRLSVRCQSLVTSARRIAHIAEKYFGKHTHTHPPTYIRNKAITPSITDNNIGSVDAGGIVGLQLETGSMIRQTGADWHLAMYLAHLYVALEPWKMPPPPPSSTPAPSAANTLITPPPTPTSPSSVSSSASSSSSYPLSLSCPSTPLTKLVPLHVSPTPAPLPATSSHATPHVTTAAIRSTTAYPDNTDGGSSNTNTASVSSSPPSTARVSSPSSVPTLTHVPLRLSPSVSLYQQWVEEESGLTMCWRWNSFFNGKELASLMQIKGKEVGQVIQQHMQWRILYPESTKEECSEYWLKGAVEEKKKERAEREREEKELKNK